MITLLQGNLGLHLRLRAGDDVFGRLFKRNLGFCAIPEIPGCSVFETILSTVEARTARVGMSSELRGAT